MSFEIVTRLPYDHPYRWDATVFGGPKLWRPSELGAPLALWLDAEDATTITLNGSTVSQWSDKSGRGNNATQSTAANQPTYSATGYGGKPSLTFDGINDSLVLPTTGVMGINTAAGFYISIAASTSSVAIQFLHSAATTELFEAHLSNQRSIRGIHGGSPYSDSIKATTYERLVSGLLYTGASLTSFLDGLPGNTVAKGVITTDSVLYIGRRGTNDYLLNGNIAEIIALNAAPSIAERQLLEGYLAWKWLLESSLPADHPYKNSPPVV